MFGVRKKNIHIYSYYISTTISSYLLWFINEITIVIYTYSKKIIYSNIYIYNLVFTPILLTYKYRGRFIIVKHMNEIPTFFFFVFNNQKRFTGLQFPVFREILSIIIPSGQIDDRYVTNIVLRGYNSFLKFFFSKTRKRIFFYSAKMIAIDIVNVGVFFL